MDSTGTPEFSVITPSMNMLYYLRRCCASVADQEGANFEHILMDGGSKDGTIEWLKRKKQIIGIVQRDNGMYDAINKGLLLARGKIISYLNADEQYLPGTLNFVKKYFDRHPEVDIIFGDVLLVRPDGSLIAYRKSYQPRWYYILSSHLYDLSCTMFFRKRIVEDGFLFNNQLKISGDQDFVVRILRHDYRVAYLRHYLAAFTMTGKNLSTSQNALLEKMRVIAATPSWVKIFRLPLNIMRMIEKLISGAYWQRMPLEYSLYVSDETDERKTFKVNKASFRWMTK